MVGGVYLAKIYFTDLSDFKIRPVLVLKQIDQDCICLQLTTQLKKLKNHALILTNNDLIDGSLRKDSLVVVPKNFTIHKSILFKKLGSVNSQKMDSIYQVFCKEIGCS